MTITSLFQRILLLLILVGAFEAKAQDYKIVIGAIDSLQSNILGEQRKIWVYVPDGGGPGVISQQRYPVVYLLDGDAHFYSVVGMIQQLSSVNGNTMCPKMIVVGIPNTDRTRDLTPTHVDVDMPFADSAFCKTSGGGENFIAFIEKELMPHIEAKYPTAPYKMLIGHSFGGLTAMQTFVHHTDLFNAYVCIDPSMMWDNQTLLKQAQKALANRKFEGKSLYLGIANTMEEGMDLNMVQKDTSVDSEHIRSILALQAAFEKNKQNGLKYRGKYYPDDTHGSAPLMTEYDALRFFFDFYALKFTMKDLTDSTGALANKYQNHFANVSKTMGYPIKPDEAEINYIGYDFLGRKLYKTAEGLFKLNVGYYPESFNVYDAYGDYFMAIGDKANAIAQFKKALANHENEGSRKKLTELENGER
jgi:predicted alpha/beta superfamily hydrolase